MRTLEFEDFDSTTVLDDYQSFVWSTTSDKVSPSVEGWWAASGLLCEAAEVLELHEKGVRKEIAVDKEKVKDELGDVLWYLAAVANAYDLSLNDIMETNIEKLNTRIYADGE
jgi:NTP pyrophosphatase (non-canonical NTP hydrolase)